MEKKTRELLVKSIEKLQKDRDELDEQVHRHFDLYYAGERDGMTRAIQFLLSQPWEG